MSALRQAQDERGEGEGKGAHPHPPFRRGFLLSQTVPMGVISLDSASERVFCCRSMLYARLHEDVSKICAAYKYVVSNRIDSDCGMRR